MTYLCMHRLREQKLTRALLTTESEHLRDWRGVSASAAAAAGHQREGLERGKRVQRRLLGRHVEVGAAAQARGVGCSVGVEHERCRVPAGAASNISAG
jgi:hypothetical protein